MRVLTSIVALMLVAVGAFWFATRARPAVAASDPFFLQPGNAARGALIFNAGGCASCHATPAKPGGHEDRTRLGGGLALKTPFGIFYAPNISSDKRDGIGDWTDAQIANALLSGVGRHKEYLYPVFPYTTYAHMTREDARDLIAYLRTLPAVPGKPPRPKLPFLLSFRPLLGVWRALYFRPGPLKLIPERGDLPGIGVAIW